MVQVQEAADGTYTLLLNGKATMTGQTQAQADRLTASFEARSQAGAEVPVAREVTKSAIRPWSWRDLFRLRGSAY